jgi:predicted hydrocarbon binding protein
VFERATVRSLPAALRARAALYLSRRLVKDTFKGSRASTRLKKGAGTVQLRASIFCEVREMAQWPMCGFYSAAVEQFLRRFDLDAIVDVAQCRASGGSGCMMVVTVRGQRAAHAAAEAA